MNTKKLRSLILTLLFVCSLTLPVSVAVTGCSTQQSTAYATLHTTELATVQAYDSYLDTAIKNHTADTEVAKVSKAFNTFQDGMKIAIAAANGNTAATAPPAVITSAANVKVAIAASK